jgi:hypothetical protein
MPFLQSPWAPLHFPPRSRLKSPLGRRNFSPEEHLSATVKHRFRQNEVILPSLLDTPGIPLIWRSCTYFPFPLSCSIRQRPKHAGAVSTSSPAPLPLQEETDDLKLAFELASPSRIASCTRASPVITGASPTCDLWPLPRRRPAGTLGPRWAPPLPSHLDRWIVIRCLKTCHLTEGVLDNLVRPDPFKSDGSQTWSARIGISEPEHATCRIQI